MTRQSNRMGPSRDWLRRMAVVEDACPSVSIGGSASDLRMLAYTQSEGTRIFGLLVEFVRRQMGKSIEQFAKESSIELSEMIEIEMHADTIPRVRTVFQLAKTLRLSETILLEVAGLVTHSPEIRDAALKFAGQSRSTAKLTINEREALEEFVKVLIDASDG